MGIFIILSCNTNYKLKAENVEKNGKQLLNKSSRNEEEGDLLFGLNFKFYSCKISLIIIKSNVR